MKFNLHLLKTLKMFCTNYTQEIHETISISKRIFFLNRHLYSMWCDFSNSSKSWCCLGEKLKNKKLHMWLLKGDDIKRQIWKGSSIKLLSWTPYDRLYNAPSPPPPKTRFDILSLELFLERREGREYRSIGYWNWVCVLAMSWGWTLILLLQKQAHRA
jgi:hypothetical protein